MNEPTVFNFRGNNVRTITIDKEPWFVAADVCKVLGLENPSIAIQSLDEDERAKFNLGRCGEANFVNESGLYTIILRCRDAVKSGSVPHAFRKWVTGEVLPAIRKTGTYSCDPVVRKFVEEVQKKASAQVRRDLAAARNAAITSLQNAGYSVDLDLIKSFTLEDCESNPAMQKQQQNKIIKQIVDPRFVATVKMEIESKEN